MTCPMEAMLTDGSLDTGVICMRDDFVVGDKALLTDEKNSSEFRLMHPCLPSVQKVEEDQGLEDHNFGFYDEDAIGARTFWYAVPATLILFSRVSFTGDIIRNYADNVAKFINDFYRSMLMLTCCVVCLGATRMRIFIFLTLICIPKHL